MSDQQPTTSTTVYRHTDGTSTTSTTVYRHPN